MTIEVPAMVVGKARAVGAHAWLRDLPALVSELEAAWGIVAGRCYDGGTEAWVGEAVDSEGRSVVLKLCLPRPGPDPWAQARAEIRVLELAGGRGCAELLRADVERGALLIERLGPSLADLALPFPERQEILCRVALEFWRPAVDHQVGLMSGADKARWLATFVERSWLELDRPCPRAVVDRALAAAARRERAHGRTEPVLVHGDLHQWNTLRAPGPTGWKLIDPDGLVAEREYDLGVVLREDPEESMGDIEAGDPRRRARWLAARTGTDADAIWEWGLVERVSTGLLAIRIGLQPVGGQMLDVAERLVDLD